MKKNGNQKSKVRLIGVSAGGHADRTMYGVSRLLIVFLTLVSWASARADDDGGPLGRTITLDIAADTPMEDALIDWGVMSGVTVMINTSTVKTHITHGVHGTLSARKALLILLDGSGLTYTESGGRIRVIPAGQNSHISSRLDESDDVTLMAQTASDYSSHSAEETPAALNRGRGDLQEVVVTAEKRTERLQDVPLAVSAVGQGDIQGLEAKTLADIAHTVPGLSFSDYGIGTNVVVRGITPSAGVATVGYYIDDTPIQILPTGGFLSNASPELYDLDRVEVLRGPQGTLYGSSAMGGTIRFITPQAPLETTSGRVSGEVYGSGGYDPSYNIGAAIGTPIIDGTLGFRGSVYYRKSGGYIDRVSRTTDETAESNVNGSSVGQIHISALWKPVSQLSITPSIVFQTESHTDLSIFVSTFGPFKQDNVLPQPGHDDFVLPSLTVNYEFAGVTVSSMTSYFERTSDQEWDYSTLVPSIFLGQAIAPGFIDYISKADQRNTQRNFSEEVHIASQPGSPFQWLVGGFYSRQRQILNFPLYEPAFVDLAANAFGGEAQAEAVLGTPLLLPGNLDFFARQMRTVRETAGFGEASYQFAGGWKLTLGGRISRTGFDYAQHANGALNGGEADSNGTEQSTPFTPKAVISYNPIRDQMIYVSASKGFRVGGVNSPVPATTCAGDLAELSGGLSPKSTYEPDSLWSYELGYKGELLDNHVSLDASVYRIKWSNIQQTITLPDCGFQFTTNYGDAQSQGAEAELSVAPVSALKLTFSGSYTDAKLTSPLFGPELIAGPGAGTIPVYSLPGDKMPLVPTWSGAFSVEYHRLITSDITGYARGEYQYVGPEPRTQPPGRVGYDGYVYNASGYGYSSIRLGGLKGNWDAAFFINNLTNARPIIGMADGLNPGIQRAIETTLQPRAFGLSVQRSF